jgi:hypothetical protein
MSWTNELCDDRSTTGMVSVCMETTLPIPLVVVGAEPPRRLRLLFARHLNESAEWSNRGMITIEYTHAMDPRGHRRVRQAYEPVLSLLRPSDRPAPLARAHPIRP